MVKGHRTQLDDIWRQMDFHLERPMHEVSGNLGLPPEDVGKLLEGYKALSVSEGVISVNIAGLYHMTRIGNLDSILNTGLEPKKPLGDKGEPIIYFGFNPNLCASIADGSHSESRILLAVEPQLEPFYVDALGNPQTKEDRSTAELGIRVPLSPQTIKHAYFPGDDKNALQIVTILERNETNFTAIDVSTGYPVRPGFWNRGISETAVYNNKS